MIFTNCHLLPGLTPGFTGESGSVRITGNNISEVSPMQLNGEKEEIIDCGGRTLLPGLIDMHTHLSFLGGVGVNDQHLPMRLLATCAEHTRHYLDYGFTTIRDCGSIYRVANYVRLMIQNGTIEGPNILACGLALVSTAAEENNPQVSHLAMVDGADAFCRAVRTEAAYQADFIKIYSSGSAYNPSGTPTQPLMTDTEIGTVVDTARSRGISVASHCHSDSSIAACIKSGVKTIEHATYLSDASLELLKNTDNCYLVPTMAALFISQTDPQERAFWMARLTPMLESCSSGISKAYQAGLTLGFGTDSTAGSKQYDQGVEFCYRKEYCHMENIDILCQATCDSAKILGLSQKLGSIQPGLLADLILVDGDPAADLSVMYQKPLLVMKSGKIVRRNNP